MRFDYVAYTLGQGVVKGRLEAENELEARQEIIRQGYKLLRVKPSRQLPGLEQIFPSIFKVGTGQLVRFSRQLATMVRGGSSLQRALEMLQSETGNRVMRRILDDVRKQVDQGSRLSVALARHPEVFNARYISVVEVGEHTGVLASSLEQLADALSREHEAVQRFKRTLMMPLFTMSASIGTLILMMTVMLPPLLDAFQSRGASVPLITQIAMAIVGGLHDNLLRIFLAIVILIILYVSLRRIPAVFLWMHLAQTKLPIFGSLIVAKELAQFSRTNSMLLEAGVALSSSLPLGISGCKNRAVTAAFVDGEQSLMSGHGFTEALARHSVLPRLWVELVMIGEENNVMGQTLNDLASAYEQEVENRLNIILALAEPMSTFLVGGVVLFMALSMFLPIYQGMGEALGK
jgi:type II secretory pathway component PulF